MYSELDVYKADQKRLKAMATKYLSTGWQKRVAKEQKVSPCTLSLWSTGKRSGGKAQEAVRQSLIEFREMVLEPFEE